MKNIIIFLILQSSVFSIINAQKYNIKGVVSDTLGENLVAATVMLMDQDSILIEYTQTDINGKFDFAGVRDKNCLIKFNYLGYFPITKGISYSGSDIDLGQIRMEEIAKELMEIVIKEAKAPLKLKGDTVEYDASQFKIPPGSTLEDLLKRLPGLEVSQDGSIQADGKGVSKLTVDGKTFFSEDPKFAIKNLPAEGVSKVQVFDKKNEEALLTGKNTASDEKTMNIELKDEFKKGGFGKVTAGIGHESVRELKGNYNKFDSKNQLSLVGVGNNTGRNGLSWDDYQDFMGSNSWNNDRNLDYGFGGGNFMYFGGNNTSELENKVSNSFFSGNYGGFPKTLMGGINYNYGHEKNRLSSRYFYSNNGNKKETHIETRNFLSAFFVDNAAKDEENKSSGNHRAELVFEHDIDSLMTVVGSLDLAHVNTITSQLGNNEIRKNALTLTSKSEYDNTNELLGNLINTSILVRKKFKKLGRAIGANFAYLKTNISEELKRFSDNSFYDDSGLTVDSLANIRQINADTLDKYVVKLNAMVSEPISKLFFMKIFYNGSKRNEDGTRFVSDVIGNERISNHFLSRNYHNEILNQRIGSSLVISKGEYNFTTGYAYQIFDLLGNYAAQDTNLFSGKVNSKYNIWIPYAEFSGNITRNTWFNINYSKSAYEPTIENLLPIVDISNPIYIKEGNPNLRPSIDHQGRFYIGHSWPASGIRINLNGNYSYSIDQVIFDQHVDENLVTRYKPINYTGGQRWWSYFNFSLPIIRNKIKASFNGSYSSSASFSKVNDVINRTNNNTVRPGVSFDITPNDGTAIYLSATVSTNKTIYDINTSQNQTINQNFFNVEFNQKLGKSWFWNSSLKYSSYKNDRFGQDQKIPIINLSIYKQLLKGNKGEIRLSLYDALNQNKYIFQNTTAAKSTNINTISLARYIMLSFSYNIKGMKSTITKDNNW